MNDLILAALIQIQKPDFPTVQQIAATCEESAPCAEVRAAEAERLRVEADVRHTAESITPTGTYYNNYSFLQCTWYVASRISVPEYMGNATNWSWGLTSAGWRTGEPRRGAIGVSHLGYAGHVVLVEGVDGNTVHISEYNYNWLSYSERWVDKAEFEYFFK